ncbi:hypothetical protein [Opitutus sp. ER46]|uniref:hypothetical protein n=1 Tax=Opitutus sp. ER46 TaxID=2161864 RepID=UPI000D31ECBC|nr:hypothetical protein [Opitutus sp. ER46]PTX90639.1 hypothetical protein DB354_18380 [Opitutus sp. ER46]
MYKATVKVNVQLFTEKVGEYGVRDIDAYLNDLKDVSARPRPDGKPVFVLDEPKRGEEQVLHIRIPEGYKNGVQITFQLPMPTDPKAESYVILGLAFTPYDQGREVGQSEFPLIAMNRDTHASELTVTDMCDQGPGEHRCYRYGILLQRVEDGQIGVFDPEFDNETPDVP